MRRLLKLAFRLRFTVATVMNVAIANLILQNHASELKGIEKVEMDTRKMTITVTYDAKQTNPAAIRTAISKSGYDADDVKADPTAYGALDGCCKKNRKPI